MSHRTSPVLRNVVVLGAPRGLPRAPRAPFGDDGATLPTQLAITKVDGAGKEPSLEELHQRARKEGYEDGLQQGLAAAQQRIDTAVDELRRRSQRDLETTLKQHADEHQARLGQLGALLGKISTQAEALVKALEERAITLAFTAIQKILCPSDSRAVVLHEVISQHMRALHGGRALRVHLHADDLLLLQGDGAVWASICGLSIDLVADAGLTPGSCVVTSGLGQIDLSIDSQLTRLRDVWLEALTQEQPKDAAQEVRP